MSESKEEIWLEVLAGRRAVRADRSDEIEAQMLRQALTDASEQTPSDQAAQLEQLLFRLRREGLLETGERAAATRPGALFRVRWYAAAAAAVLVAVQLVPVWNQLQEPPAPPPWYKEIRFRSATQPVFVETQRPKMQRDALANALASLDIQHSVFELDGAYCVEIASDAATRQRAAARLAELEDTYHFRLAEGDTTLVAFVDPVEPKYHLGEQPQ